ncbi:nuclear transport factor 2 family protein [Lysobacter sp.]|uniref:nuclear transport factor 2 family protein n=1 Tax=Lysobacter sp. TaxID=72226 RepID=UPI002D753D93|nr:nuclear transport factor 2 family protein [Lysobacter sp.]HZX78126.1 nuclear transport factor 2 family protein [Lysobacter sp.]
MMRALLLCLALVISLPALAETDAELLALDATWNELRMKPDVAGLDRILADDWMLTHSDGRVQYKADYLDELRTSTRRNQGIGNEDLRVRRYGDTMVVTGASVQSGISNGQPWSGRFRFTRTWVKRDGAWIMVSSHSSRVAAAQ